MLSYSAPLDDFRFIFSEVLSVEKYLASLGFREATPELIEAVLREGARLMETLVQPLNRSGDREGCRFENGQVVCPPGYKAAFAAYRDGGWSGLTADVAYGGQGLPRAVGIAFNEMASSACMAFAMFPNLSRGVGELIASFGTPKQKQTFVPKIVCGAWTGAICLTEAQAGTDLGRISTKAEAVHDHYQLTGTKIFISSGDHDLTENIIYLVLARIPGAPAGAAGLSLFIVSKFNIEADNALGSANSISVGSVERKMGNHGNATCVLHFDNATGYLVGDPHKGLQTMFTMLNVTRLGSGVQGLAVAETAYQYAVRYAKQRVQGRALSGGGAASKNTVAIINHPDVRRMLLRIRSFVEGARALALWVGVLLDCAAKHPDEAEKQYAHDLVSVLTPTIKAYFTDSGFECAVLAQQVYGGHGYIVENGIEQLVRDARLPMLYEGANGVQALDLVSRKLTINRGRMVTSFFSIVESFVADHQDNREVGVSFILPLADVLRNLRQATETVLDWTQSRPDVAAAVSADYLRAFALVAMGYMWSRMAIAASRQITCRSDAPAEIQFWQSKLNTGRFFMLHTLPEVEMHCTRMRFCGELITRVVPESF